MPISPRRSRSWRSCGPRVRAGAAPGGDRLARGGPSLVGVHQPCSREVMGRVFNLVMRVITGLPFHDTQCGFKLFEARRGARGLLAPAARWLRLRRGSAVHRAAPGVSRAGSSGALEQRGGHQGQHVARGRGLPGTRCDSVERYHREIQQERQDLTTNEHRWTQLIGGLIGVYFATANITEVGP